MPQPTTSDVHVNRPLTNISVAYTQTGTFVSKAAFPLVPVSKQSDQYYVYTKADWLRSQAQKRAPATESAGSGWTLTTDNYRCDVIAIHKDIADEQRENQDQPLALDREAAMWTARQIMMKMEQDWQTEFFTTGVWDTDLTGGTNFTKWSDGASDPVNDIQTQQDSVQGVTGYLPNVGVSGVDTARELRNNSDIIDRIKYTQRGVVTNDLVAAMLNLDKFLIANAITDTSVEGGTPSPGYIVSSDDFLLVYSTSSPSLMAPSGGYTFVWTGMAGSSQGMQTRRLRLDREQADRVETQTAYDQKVVATDVGVYFDDAVD